MKALAKILYEDSRAVDVKDFALHLLVLRCVLERLGWPDERWYELKNLLHASPKKGDSNLLKACEDPREARGVRRVFAVFDSDKIRENTKLGLSAKACKTRVREAILKRSGYASELRVVLLEQNMETVVTAVQRCKGLPTTGKLLPPDRDSVLASIAWRPEQASFRACVLEAVPSLAYLVDKLAALVTSP
jgi:hypothetical protein